MLQHLGEDFDCRAGFVLAQYALKAVHGSVPRCSFKHHSFVARVASPFYVDSVITKRECAFIVSLYPLRSLLEVVSRQNGRTDIWTHFCCVFPLQ